MPDTIDLLKLQNQVELVQKAGGHFLPPEARHDVERVVVLVSGSRCGSSYLFRALRQTGLFWTPNGEETPLYRLFDVGRVRGLHDSDEMTSYTDADLDNVGGAILNDLGRFTSTPSAGIASDFITRLLLQRPSRAREVPVWQEVLAAVVKNAGVDVTPEKIWWRWLEKLKLSLGPYDGGRGEFSEISLEEPPWIVPSHTEKPSRESLTARPVLLKTSTNVYRMDWLKKVFPRARCQWVFLQRNPLGAVNGLIDGWLSNAFHSHDLEGVARLQIAGYSDVKKGGEHWWKFDLPPGWSEFTQAPLERVALFQWTSAYESIIHHLEGESYVGVKYEDLLMDPEIPLRKILTFVEAGERARLKPVPPTMATLKPQAGRWRARREVLMPLLEDQKLKFLSECLRYPPSKADSWI